MRLRPSPNLDFALAGFLFAAAAAFYFGDPNTDFVGDDDYIAVSGFTGFSRLLLPWIYAGSGGGVTAYLKDLVGSLFLVRYGPLPAAIHGIWLAGWELLGLPFSLRAVHIPLALFAALIPVFFFRILRNMGLGRVIAVMGAVTLASSPVFFGIPRGLATYWGAGAVFAQVSTIWALQRLARVPDRPIIPGLAVFNIATSDPLFFLTLPSLLIAFCARGQTPADAFRRPREAVNAVLAGAAPLRSPWIWGPATIMIVLTVLSTAAVLVANHYQVIGQPMVTRLMAVLLEHHGGFRIPAPDPVLWFRQAAMTFGEPTLFLFGAALLVIIVRRTKILVGLEGWFALFCTTGFGLLFYVQQPGANILLYYQLYIIVALLLFLILAFRSLGPVAFRLAMTVMMSASMLGAAARTWNTPTKFDPEGFPTLKYEIRHPEQGTKALGLLARAAVVENKATPLEVSITAAGFESSLLAFSGLARRSGYFRAKFGIEVPVKLEARARDLDRSRCDAPTSLTLRRQKAPPGEPTALLCIVEGDRTVAALLLVGLRMPATPASLQVDDLNEAFDRQYPRLTDLFPPY